VEVEEEAHAPSAEEAPQDAPAIEVSGPASWSRRRRSGKRAMIVGRQCRQPSRHCMG